MKRLAGNKLSTNKDKSLKEKIALQRELEAEHMKLMRDVYSHYENGTFMSIDIVGSTRLKDGVDSIVVVDTFQSFHQFIKDCIEGCVSNVFSGDGIMCLYKDAQEPVDTAIKILAGLEDFNKNYSGLNGYMNIRVGINTGSILLGETRELGHLTERSIDIAGHLQKYGIPGQLLISESTLKNIRNKGEFTKRWKKIDNTTVFNHNINFTPFKEQYAGSPIKKQFMVIKKFLENSINNISNEMKRKIIFIGLGLIVLISSINVFNNTNSGKHNIPKKKSSLERVKSIFKFKPKIIGTRISGLKSGQGLSSVKVKNNGEWSALPGNVFMIIPKGLNTNFNKKKWNQGK